MPRASSALRPDRIWVIVLVCAALVGAVWLLPRPDQQQIAVLALTLAGLAAALNLIVGLGRHLSLAHGAIFGLGAYTSALLIMKRDWSYLPAAAAAVVLTAVLALLIGWPSLRTHGLAFSITTLAFGAIVVEFLQNQKDLTEGPTGLVGVPFVEINGFVVREPQHQAVLAVSVLLIIMLVTRNLRGSGSGMALRAAGADEQLARVLGIRTSRVQLLTFVASGGLAGLAGTVYAHTRLFVEPSDFGFVNSFEAVVYVIVGGAGSLFGPVLGAVTLVFAPEYLGITGAGRNLLYGIFLLAITLLARGGIAAVATDVFARVGGLRQKRAAAPPPPAPTAAAPPAVPTDGPDARRPERAGLVVEGVTRAFGGLLALSDVSFSVAPDDGLVGIIGPNGAGKSTLMAVLSGVLPPDAGRVVLGDRDVTSASAELRAALGMRRTFQGSRGFDEMSVEENLCVALHLHRRVRFLPDLVLGPRAEGTGWQPRLHEVLAQWNLEEVRGQRLHDLPYGTRAQVALAMAFSVRPRVLLLDEPLAGMTGAERGMVMARIREIAAGDVCVLLIEHDVDTVFEHCDRIMVLSHGQLIADGEPAAVRSDPEVLKAYFGTEVEEVADARG